MAKSCPMMQQKTVTDHPCFGGDHSRAGRIHLPVAPGCNIKCGFCERRFDCANESRPGVTSRVLSPQQAVKRVQMVKDHLERQCGPALKVAGIAGPGDPLSNPRTFETFKLVHEAFPEMTLCLSTNGLLLPEMIDEIIAHDIHSLTVTINALTAATGARAYEWIKLDGRRLEGEAAAAILLERQLIGLAKAAAAGMLVKVNHVYIPGINTHETIDLACRARDLGAEMMNIMPVIPVGRFRGVTPPAESDMELIRNQAELILSQARHCKQCRADAAGLVGNDLDLETLEAAGRG